MIAKLSLLAAVCACATVASAQPKFTAQELLGRVTSHSVTVSAEADADIEAYYEYGTTPGSYSAKTATATYPGGRPFELVLDHLDANSRYYYRMQYRQPGASAFTPRTEHTVQTQRSRGSTFTFAVEFDPHMDENSDAATYALTLANEAKDSPDFLISLGDSFMSDKLQPVTAQGVLDRVRLLRSYYELLCHSAPLFLSLGNHEGEWGSNLNGTAQNVAVWDTVTRKQYFPNPAPDSFYSGDATDYAFVGQRQSYFSWEWGDALFVVLDPYWNQPAGAESRGNWSLTLGRAQYDWLKRTLETSTAQYKFVFAHNLIGGINPNGLGPMRGGVEAAKYLEWGGYNLDGSWGFDQARPGWPMPIHQLLVANHVTAFFHGHDHLYAKQDLDGIVYQEGPQPAARNTNLGTRGIDYGYTHGTVLGGTGYLRVRVSPAGVNVDYVQTWLPAGETGTRKNGMVADSYVITPRLAGLKMLSAASYGGGTVAPESIVAAFGDGLSGASVAVTDVAGVRRDAAVLGTAPTQVNFVVPPETAAGLAQVIAGNSAGSMLVDIVAPGLFTANADGRGVAAAVALHVKSDGGQTSELVFQCASGAGSCAAVPLDASPAAGDLYLSLYGTGIRKRLRLEDVTVLIGGQPAAVSYAGAHPVYAGLDQVNVRVPPGLAGSGVVELSLSVSGKQSNTVLIHIR